MVIDNGNHLLLSGNHAALDFLREIGAGDRLIGPPAAPFPSTDLAGGELDAAFQRWPHAIVDFRPRPARAEDARARLPDAGARLVRPPPGKTVGEVIGCLDGPLYRPDWSSRCCSPR